MLTNQSTTSFYHQVSNLARQLDELSKEVQDNSGVEDNSKVQLGAKKEHSGLILMLPSRTQSGRSYRVVATSNRKMLCEELRRLADQSENEFRPKTIRERQVRKPGEDEKLNLASVRSYLDSLQQTDAYINGEKLNDHQTQILDIMEQSLKKALKDHGANPKKIKDAVLKQVSGALPGFDQKTIHEVMPGVLEALSKAHGDEAAAEAILYISAGVSHLLNPAQELGIPEVSKITSGGARGEIFYKYKQESFKRYIAQQGIKVSESACSLFLGIVHYRHRHSHDDSTPKMCELCSQLDTTLKKCGVKSENTYFLDKVLDVIPQLQAVYPEVDFQELKETMTTAKKRSKEPVAEASPESAGNGSESVRSPLHDVAALRHTIIDQLKGIEIEADTYPSLVYNPDEPLQSLRPGWLMQCVRYQSANDPTESLTVDEYIRLKERKRPLQEPAGLAESEPKYDINLVSPKDGRRFFQGQIQDLRLYILLYNHVENALGIRSPELERLKNIRLIKVGETPDEWLGKLRADRHISSVLFKQVSLFIQDNMMRGKKWDENRLISGIDEEIQENAQDVRKASDTIDEHQLMIQRRDSMEPETLSEEGKKMLLDKYKFEVQTDDKILASGVSGTMESPDTAYHYDYDFTAGNCSYHAFFPNGGIQTARVFINRIKNEDKTVFDKQRKIEILVSHQENIRIAIAAIRNAGGILIQRPWK